ncbi:MAG: D-alanyl-D-alanine carboxypeptidase [Caldilineae bacterium]|nr:MAG: D-alanyl-D-alanine carboxypeptidase [Caldilineae bacterium]
MALIPVALLTTGFGPPTLVDRDAAPAYRYTVGQLRQMQMARRPPEEVSARAVLVYDLDSDRVLMARNEAVPLPPASLTKLMTALLVLERGDLDRQVTVQVDDLVGGASMGLRAGETLTVRELLWGLLIPSGNDAAMALARAHSGQVHVFVQRMNLRAQELGLAESHFANPHGFDATGHTSSARDLLTLTRMLWTYPLFREIVGTAETTVAGHTLRSTNQLLGAFPGANGVKTGTTPAAGQSLVAGVNRDGHQLFMVVLGSRDRYADVRTLYSQYERTYTWVRLQQPQRFTVLDRLYDPQGKRWFVQGEGVASDVFLPIWDRTRLRPFRRVQPPIGASWTPGADVGVLEWRLGDQVIGVQRLILTTLGG